MATMRFRVYGAEGHRQRESFCPSYKHDFSTPEDGVRILEVNNSDKTGTNQYTEVIITRPSYEECVAELDGQVSDGIFENSRTGTVMIADMAEELEEIERQCVEEGYPSNGSTYRSRAAEVEQYYKEQYPEFFRRFRGIW